MSEGPTKVDVGHVAGLANLDLTHEEKVLFRRQLADIVRYVEQVQQVDTSGVPATANALARPGVDRADEARPSLPRDEALANAPDARSGFFRVPRVLAPHGSTQEPGAPDAPNAPGAAGAPDAPNAPKPE